MSLNRITPSGWNARHGWSVISVIRSTVSDRSRKLGCFTAKSRYSCMYRPAWRIIHAGGRSTGKPFAARTSRGSEASDAAETAKEPRRLEVAGLGADASFRRAPATSAPAGGAARGARARRRKSDRGSGGERGHVARGGGRGTKRGRAREHREGA